MPEVQSECTRTDDWDLERVLELARGFEKNARGLTAEQSLLERQSEQIDEVEGREARRESTRQQASETNGQKARDLRQRTRALSTSASDAICSTAEPHPKFEIDEEEYAEFRRFKEASRGSGVSPKAAVNADGAVSPRIKVSTHSDMTSVEVRRGIDKSELLKQVDKSELFDPAEHTRGLTIWTASIAIVPKDRAIRNAKCATSKPVASVPKHPPMTLVFRLIGESRATSKTVRRARHPSRMVENLIGVENEVSLRLDIAEAFHRLRLTEESRKLKTNTAQIGRFRHARMQIGISCASEKLTEGIRSMLAYRTGQANTIDDILALNKDEAKQKCDLSSVLQWLQSRHLKPNRTDDVSTEDRRNATRVADFARWHIFGDTRFMQNDCMRTYPLGKGGAEEQKGFDKVKNAIKADGARRGIRTYRNPKEKTRNYSVFRLFWFDEDEHENEIVLVGAAGANSVSKPQTNANWSTEFDSEANESLSFGLSASLAAQAKPSRKNLSTRKRGEEHGHAEKGLLEKERAVVADTCKDISVKGGGKHKEEPLSLATERMRKERERRAATHQRVRRSG
jgi:hypothetical protein